MSLSMNETKKLKSVNNTKSNSKEESLRDVLTQHFFLYSMYLRSAFDSITKPSEKTLVQVWINRLLETPNPDLSNAILRNMYLAQLIVNIGDGKLQAPFSSMPPKNGPLEDLGKSSRNEPEKPIEINEDIFEPLAVNRELVLQNFNHVSSDNRTYVSIRYLSDGTTLFGYVAITIDDVNAEPLWVDSRGEPIQALIPSQQDLPVISLNSDGLTINENINDLASDVWEVLSQRRVPETRKRAKDLYLMIYEAIEQEMLREQNPNSTECSDPYVEKLIALLLADMEADSIQDSTAYRRINLLSVLKKRIKAVIKKIEDRQGVLEVVETNNSTQAMQLIFQPTAMCQDLVSIMAMQEAMQGKPTSKTTELLSVQYPLCIVNVLMKLVTKEKLRMVQLIKSRLDNITREMYKELRESVARGLCNYKNARMEWKRTWDVVKEYEDVTQLIEALLAYSGDQEARQQFIEKIENEILMALSRLNTANLKTEQLELEIDLLHKKVHALNNKLEFEKKTVSEQNNVLEIEIVYEKKAIEKRRATTIELEAMAIDDCADDKNNLTDC